MKLKPIAANQNVISYPNGSEIFFSYQTPVAGYSPANGYFKTKEWYSTTTTRHINKYLPCKDVAELDQETINNLLSEHTGVN
tara:strand:+ start:96 stop:341 length:246 start_codon:yes stop_codon:yes gene_type:complete